MRLIDGDALIELINGGYDLDFDEVMKQNVFFVRWQKGKKNDR